jgi:hypothetical protein
MLLCLAVIFQDAPGGNLQAMPLAPRVPLFRVLPAKLSIGQLSGPGPFLPGTNPYFFRLKQLSCCWCFRHDSYYTDLLRMHLLSQTHLEDFRLITLRFINMTRQSKRLFLL